MSQKQQLQKHIDGLCEELEITEPQYNSKTKVEQLQAIIDELEAKLPEDSDDVNNETEEVPESEDDDALDTHQLEVGDDEQNPSAAVVTDYEQDVSNPVEDSVQDDELPSSIDTPSGTEVGLVDISELDPDDVVEDASVEVDGDEKGNVAIKAKVTIMLSSHGKPVKILRGETAYVSKEAAMQAVEEKLAVFLTA